MLELADVACFSMFHFQRLFALYTGFGVAKYVLFLRLKKACWQLAFRQHMSMIDIALSCGFNDQHSFSRAFKRESGLSPLTYRKRYFGQRAQPHETVGESMQPTDTLTTFLNLDLKHRLSVNDSKPHHNGQVKLVDFPFTAIAFLAHRGCPTTVLHTVSRFIQWRRENGPSAKIIQSV